MYVIAASISHVSTKPSDQTDASRSRQTLNQ